MSKISIIIPCYNQAQYLNEALQSIFDQTYSNWECIIINDGSTDNTEKLTQEWVAKDIRFKSFSQSNSGLSSARNLGLDNSEGDFIQFLDADDYLDSKKLELSLAEIAKLNLGNQKIVISNFRMFTIEKKIKDDPFCELKQEYFNFKSVLFDWDYKFNIPIHCGLFDSSLFDNFRFNIDLKAREDWIMWLAFFKKSIDCVFLNETLVLYRLHPESMTKEVKVMEENHFQAIKYLQNSIPAAMYNEYLLFVLSQKIKEIVNLKTEIKKYKNSSGYKILEKLKKNKGLQFFIRKLK